MADDLPDVPALRMLEPPRGGLEHLRERLAAPARWPWAVAAAVVVGILAVWIAVGRDAGRREPPVVARGALADQSIAPNFYWVTSRPAGPEVVPSAPAQVSISEAPQVQTMQP
jgi:hypothetical protein